MNPRIPFCPGGAVAARGFLLLLSTLLFVSSNCGAAPAPSRRTFTNSAFPMPQAVAATARPLQPENLGETLEFEVPLQMRDLAKLQVRVGYSESVSWDDLAQNYLPLQADYDAVCQWLQQRGFTITRTDPNRLAVFASGTLAQIQENFQVQMVKVTVDGVDYSAAASHPSLPAAIGGPVLGINGLQPYRHPHHHLIKKEALPLGPSPATNDRPPFLVSEILGAYNAKNLGVNGTGEKIAILIDSVPLDSDLTNFWSANAIPQTITHIEKVAVTGSLPLDLDGEATLDVEWSSSVAPGAVVRIYAAGDLSFVNLDKGLAQLIEDLPSQPSIHQLSMSLGLGEDYFGGAGSSEFATESQYYATLAARNVSILVSSGDAGSNPDGTGHNFSNSPGPLQVEYASSDVSVTGVGGTNLFLNPDGTVNQETGWGNTHTTKQSLAGGSGGGISQFFTRPIWQVGSGLPSGTKRCVPDVSLVASDTTYAYYYYQGQASGVAGTSWSAPTWAGFTSLINHARRNNSLAPLGLLNPLVYPLMGTANFRDVTVGTNGQYNCGPGYDLVTGIGVPNIGVLLVTLAGTGSTAPLISGFTPVSGAPGSTVIISGANLAQATAVNFNGVAATNFTPNSGAQITATVPQGATTGPISVTVGTTTAVSVNPYTVLSATPASDNFALSRAITGKKGTVATSTVNASLEPGEPSILGDAGGHSIWFTWSAPSSGVFTFSTLGSGFDTLLAVYTGPAYGSLSLVAANDDASGGGVTSAVSFYATNAGVYRITVDGHAGASGTVNLNWTANDTGPVISSFSPGAGAAGDLIVVNGGDFTGASGFAFNGVPAAFVVNSATQITATVPLGATTGNLTVTIGNAVGASAGLFTVNTPPANDNFVNAVNLPGDSGTVTGTNLGATKEPGESNHAGNAGGRSIWYQWTAPSSNNVTFNTFGSSFPTLLAAYTGGANPAVNALQPVASNRGGGVGFTSQLAFAATVGTTYYVAVDGVYGASGSVVLNWADNVATPDVAGFNPVGGGSGTAVTLTGTSFSSATAVKFGGVAATFAIISDTQINTAVPAGAVTGPVSVTNISGTGSSATNFAVSSAPGNDNLTSAFPFIPIGSENTGTQVGAVIGANIGASKEASEPIHAGNAGGASVWWTWTAPATADYAVSTLGSSFNTLLAVYTGATYPALSLVGGNDDDPNGGVTSLLILHAVAGTHYAIAVDGYNGATGTITLSIVPAQSGALFTSGFEASEGYSASTALNGQNHWTGAGTGGTGILVSSFAGLGQQAFIGSKPPKSGVGQTSVWQPITYNPATGDRLEFLTAMQITASTNGFSDDFAWSAYNQVGARLFTLHFDNATGKIGFELDDGNGVRDTGFTFDNQTIYLLTIKMDFTSDVADPTARTWQAALNGSTIVSPQPLTTVGVGLSLQKIEADWNIEGAQAGDNEMIFDNYTIENTGGHSPGIILDPQPQTVTAGSDVNFSVVASGTQPLSYQWKHDSMAIPGATTPLLRLFDVQADDQGLYYVEVTNSAGTFPSASVRLTVTPADAPNLSLYRPAGWSDKLVVTNFSSSTLDDTSVNSITPLFIDYAFTNSGTQPAAGGFQNSLYIDGNLINTWIQSAQLPPGATANITGYPIGKLSAGLHRVQIVIDSTNQLTESNKGDNVYLKTLFVSNPSGYRTVAATAAPLASGRIQGAGAILAGTKATLVALPADGYRFVSWTDAHGTVSKSGTLSFKVTEDVSLVANFARSGAGAPPSITISVPTPQTDFATIQSTVNLAGVASSGAGVQSVTWSTGGKTGKATGTTAWTARSIPIAPGDNSITVTVMDTQKGTSSATLHVSSVASTTFAGAYSGLLTSGTGTSLGYIGFAQFTVGSTGAFSGAFWFAGQRHALSGSFAPSGTYTALLNPTSRSPVTLALTLAPSASPEISGMISVGASTSSLVALRAGYNAKTHPWPNPGRFTVLLPADPEDTSSPAGSGIAVATVDAGGIVKLAGSLADGAPFSGGTALPASGDWPFYAALYGSGGDIAGPLTFPTTATLGGVADWFKVARTPGGRYPDAIRTRVTVRGNLFQAQKAPQAELLPGSRTATLSEGDLPGGHDLVNTVSLSGVSDFVVVNPNAGQIKLKLNPATGMLTGSFVIPGTKRVVPVHSIILEGDDTAAGYFLGPLHGGSFEMSAAEQ